MEGFFLPSRTLFMLGYFLWEQRVTVFVSLALLAVALYFTAWLLRPSGRVIQLWMPWIFLFRLIRRR